MIIQGSNNPIVFIFSDINDVPASDMSVLLKNEITELKRWGLPEAVISEDGMEYTFPIRQEESVNWPEGRCAIEAKWLDSEGQTIFMYVREEIRPWRDSRILEGAE